MLPPPPPTDFHLETSLPSPLVGKRVQHTLLSALIFFNVYKTCAEQQAAINRQPAADAFLPVPAAQCRAPLRSVLCAQPCCQHQGIGPQCCCSPSWVPFWERCLLPSAGTGLRVLPAGNSLPVNTDVAFQCSTAPALCQTFPSLPSSPCLQPHQLHAAAARVKEETQWAAWSDGQC